MRSIVGLDISAARCHIGFAAESGIHGSCMIPTAHDYELLLNLTTNRVRGLLSPNHDIGDIKAIGISIEGEVQDNRVRSSRQLPHLVGAPLAQDFSRHFGNVPIVVIDNLKAIALGESSFLQRPLIYIVWGDEVGLSVTGSVPVHPGSTAAIERLSGQAIVERFGVSVEKLSTESWQEILKEMSTEIHNISLAYPGLPIVLGGEITLKQMEKTMFAELQRMVAELSSARPTLQLPKYKIDYGLRGVLIAAKQLVRS